MLSSQCLSWALLADSSGRTCQRWRPGSLVNHDGTLPSCEHVFDTGWVEYVKPPPPWEAGRQGILNALTAQMPEHTFGQPVPVVIRIVWEHDGEEHIDSRAGLDRPTRLHSPAGPALQVHRRMARRLRREADQPRAGTPVNADR